MVRSIWPTGMLKMAPTLPVLAIDARLPIEATDATLPSEPRLAMLPTLPSEARQPALAREAMLPAEMLEPIEPALAVEAMLPADAVDAIEPAPLVGPAPVPALLPGVLLGESLRAGSAQGVGGLAARSGPRTGADGPLMTFLIRSADGCEGRLPWWPSPVPVCG